MPRSGSLLFQLALVASCLTLVSSPLGAQGFNGSIVGTITDASNPAIPGVTAALTNAATGDRRTAVSGSDGTYRFVNLVPGTYKVEVEQSGFKRYTRDQ